MARLFVRLKLSLLASAFKRGPQQAIGLIVGAIVVLPFAAFASWGLATAGLRTDAGVAIVPMVFAAFALGWTLLPPLTFGVDETLDPARLRLLPLTRRQLLVGQTAAGAVGVGPLATLLVLGGAATGLATSPLAAVFAVATTIAQFVLCLVVARAVTTALSRRLRSRKGRDFIAIVGVFLGLAGAAIGQIPNLLFNVGGLEDNPEAVLDVFRRAADIVGLTPLGWGGRSLVAASEGSLGLALLWLAGTVLLVVGLARWWSASVERATTTPTTDPTEAVGDEDLFPSVLNWLPRNRLGAAAAREFRYIWRVPQLRAQWVVLPVFGVALVAAVALLGWLDARAPLIVPALIVFTGFGSLNQFGADRAATWLLVVSGDGARSDIAGKNLSAAVIVLPFATAVSVALGAVTGGWQWVAPAVVASIAVFAVGYGVGNVASVLAPQPLPETGNLWATNTGAGCATAMMQFAALLSQGLLLAPFAAAVAAAVVWSPGLVPVAVGLGLLYAVGVWWVGLRIAAARLADRGPEIVAALAVRP